MYTLSSKHTGNLCLTVRIVKVSREALGHTKSNSLVRWLRLLVAPDIKLHCIMQDLFNSAESIKGATQSVTSGAQESVICILSPGF